VLSQLRIARPVNDLERSARMYIRGLELVELGRFEDHAGFDGVMLGRTELNWHLEFTHARHGGVTPSPTPEDLLVIYLPDHDEWMATCARLLQAGFMSTRSFNPYWETRGRTFSDADGYRIVVENDRWPGVGPQGASR